MVLNHTAKRTDDYFVGSFAHTELFSDHEQSKCATHETAMIIRQGC